MPGVSDADLGWGAWLGWHEGKEHTNQTDHKRAQMTPGASIRRRTTAGFGLLMTLKEEEAEDEGVGTLWGTGTAARGAGVGEGPRGALNDEQGAGDEVGERPRLAPESMIDGALDTEGGIGGGGGGGPPSPPASTRPAPSA